MALIVDEKKPIDEVTSYEFTTFSTAYGTYNITLVKSIKQISE